MKYVITWHERPAASFSAQERILGIFKEVLRFKQFVVRVGEFGGYMIVDTDKPKTYIMSQFEFKVEPVVDVMDAVAVEVKAIEYRKKNAP